MDINAQIFLYIENHAYFSDLADIVRLFLPCRVLPAEVNEADISVIKVKGGYYVNCAESLSKKAGKDAFSKTDCLINGSAFTGSNAIRIRRGEQPVSLQRTAVSEIPVKHESESMSVISEITVDELGSVQYLYRTECGEKCLETEKTAKREIKLALYRCLKSHFDVSPPWGALTGIRPVKLAEEMNAKGMSMGEFKELFDVRASKIVLIEDIIKCQRGLKEVDYRAVDLYAGIPFCVSRCSYCSFGGGLLSRHGELVEPYIDALVQELRGAVDIITENGLRLKNIYIGGGTPTSFTARQLERIFAVLPRAKEFTVETGRPDTLTSDYVSLFVDAGVTRVSVNPQSFNQATLDRVNRKHTIGEVYAAYEAVKGKFDVNMDLIAGLIGEVFTDFKNSLDRTVSLRPQNITVHTLALKSGSALKERLINSPEEWTGAREVARMVDYAAEKLKEHGYSPYYLYRQKYMSENLENVGYCLTGKQCGYNIDTMEETASIIACGTGAISKRLFKGNRIERLANTKDIALYISRILETVGKKRAFFE